ncbi:hypothetical protein [Sunxiuqinia rutila]|uniref:hypothetical protein n=1 Tax=Sunxiuqinia rutila TaxID=1397841 RepID=UPI003D367D88
MKKRNLFFALLLGAVASFTSCSKDDDLTPEEIEANEKQELVDEVTTNFNTVTSTLWTFKEFQPSEDLLAASETEDGAIAKTIMVKAEHAKNFNLILSFVAEGDSFNPKVDVNLSDEEIDTQLKAFQDAVYPEFAEWGFILGKESTLASFRRVIAAPFAADELKIDDITNEETGLCIFSIAMRDFSELSYEDAVLAQKQLVAGNSDRIYFNEDGTLTVETTDVEFGVSKLILEEVK